MSRVLCIDCDDLLRRTLSQLFASRCYEFAGTGTAREGLGLAREWDPDVALLELRLPDMPGLDVLARLAAECPRTACVIFTEQPQVDTAIKAIRLGASDCVMKPASQRDIIEAVERALARRLRPLVSPPIEAVSLSEAYAATRWAGLMVRAIDSPQDPRTLVELSRMAFVSVGGLRNWCRTNHVTARASLAFARALRAVYRFGQDHSTRPENLLSIVDLRTIAKFVRKCGGQGNRLPDTVAEFLERQQFISSRESLEAVQTLLNQRQVPRPRG